MDDFNLFFVVRFELLSSLFDLLLMGLLESSDFVVMGASFVVESSFVVLGPSFGSAEPFF